MNIEVCLPSPVIKLNWPDVLQHNKNPNNIAIYCKRDDLIHPLISGNKWRKLSATLSRVKELQCKHILSFGGAYSNHLHALSYACMALNIQLTAVVRGNYERALTPTLCDMLHWGTTLKFVSKIDYQKRTDDAYCKQIMAKFSADYLIPEGGSHIDCLQGVAEIMNECRLQTPEITHMVLPVASGGTLAGLITSKALPNVKLVGIGVLKGVGYLETLVKDLIAQQNSSDTQAKTWQILHDFHHGGYAKCSEELAQFVQKFNQQGSHLSSPDKLLIEPVYSGKCFYAVDQLIRANFFPENSKVIILHTGGFKVQGKRHK